VSRAIPIAVTCIALAGCGSSKSHPVPPPTETTAPPAATAEPAVAPRAEASATIAPAAVPCQNAGAPVDIEELATVIRRQISPAAVHCYKEALTHRAGQWGQLVLSIRVTAGGGVEDVQVVKNAGLDPAVSECVAGVARTASFPCNPGGLVNVPFNFQVSRATGGDAGP
jgi:hypothetical protein